MTTRSRIAGAPISWGVCEVPGWGPMLNADRVLRELRGLDLDAIELGAPGFLPEDGDAVRSLLDSHGVELIGGFVPVVLHDPSRREATLAAAEDAASLLAKGGATNFVTAVVTDLDWSPRRPLGNAEWEHLLMMLGELDALCATHGLVQVLHPHVGTLVETAADVERVLAGSDVRWCLDTGHLAIGGVDPVAFAKEYGGRVAHVHLKDVAVNVAARLNSGELSLMEATFAGMFQPLGLGDIDVAAVIDALESGGYRGWYVLEQDISISGDEPPEEGSGPVEDVAVSLGLCASGPVGVVADVGRSAI